MNVDAELARGEELEKLLALAEKLQEKSDSSSRQIANCYFGISVCTGISVACFLWSFTNKAMMSSIMIAVIGVMFLGLAAGFFVVRQAWTRRRWRDRFALREVVALLRETEHVLTREAGWSTLERAQFRIRLARFGVDHPGSFRSDTSR